MKRVLLINGHRDPKASQFGKALFEAASSLPSVTSHALMETYPDFKINGDAERALLSKHEAIVLQFPLYWYSSPAIVKEWLDEVLARGWAYGGGNALSGKHLLIATTTGGPEKVYQREGGNRFTREEFLRPFEQTAHLCQMVWHRPFIMYGVRYLAETQIQQCCSDYVRRIEQLV
jgi:glutathione-regulated potassium-efflux system ancillary protein KefG